MDNEDNEYFIKSRYVKVKSELVGKIGIIALGLFILLFVIRGFYGNKKIGSWFQKPGEYSTQYWVYLEPDSTSTKNYRVKGDIDKVSLGDGAYGYFLRTVYWNNGGNSDFSDCQLTSPKGDYCIDDNDKGYKIRLGESLEE